MLAGVSHDLRTPLTRMRLHGTLIRLDAKAIGNDIDEMEEMIDAYLAFAAGEVEEQPQETDVAGLLERLVEQAQKTHKFDISYPPRRFLHFQFGKTRSSVPFQISFQTPFAIQQNHCVIADS